MVNDASCFVVFQIARLFSGNQPVAKKAGSGAISRRKGSGGRGGDKGEELVVHALRLVENTDRFSSDMRALEKGKCRSICLLVRQGEGWWRSEGERKR